MNTNLSCSLIYEEKIDGAKLKKIILDDSEWDLLDELYNILAPFKKVIQDFSENTYVTLSQIIPIVTSLINSLELSDNSDNLYKEEYDNKTITSDSEEILINQ